MTNIAVLCPSVGLESPSVAATKLETRLSEKMIAYTIVRSVLIVMTGALDGYRWQRIQQAAQSLVLRRAIAPCLQHRVPLIAAIVVLFALLNASNKAMMGIV